VCSAVPFCTVCAVLYRSVQYVQYCTVLYTMCSTIQYCTITLPPSHILITNQKNHQFVVSVAAAECTNCVYFAKITVSWLKMYRKGRREKGDIINLIFFRSKNSRLQQRYIACDVY